MATQPNRPEQDPAEGSRETIDRELARQDGADTPSRQPAPGVAQPIEQPGPADQQEPAEGSRETVDRELARQDREGGQGRND